MADVKEQTRGMDNACECGSATGVADTVRQASESAYNAASGMVGHAKERMEELKSEAGTAARQACDQVQQWAGEAYDCTTKAMGSLSAEVTEVVKRYPIQSVLVGFGIGLLIGRTVRST